MCITVPWDPYLIRWVSRLPSAVSDSACLNWGLLIHISSTFPCDADATSLGPTLEEISALVEGWRKKSKLTNEASLGQKFGSQPPSWIDKGTAIYEF